jgi:hypothetical protein
MIRVDVLYYALGGGHGHVLRGLAILRCLGSGVLVGPGRLAAWAQAMGVGYLAPPEPFDRAWIGTLPRPDLLVVDVFPRGVMGELRPLLGRVPAWLVTRRVSSAYYLDPDVQAAIERHHECVVWGEEPPAALTALSARHVRVPPILLGAEPLTTDDARRRLGVPAGERLVLGLGTGDPPHQARLCRLLAKVTARVGAHLVFVSSDLPPVAPVVRAFPAAPLLSAADVVVTAAGYHAYHEVQASGVPAVFIPRPRRYDDQAWRARDAAVARDPYELEAWLRRLLASARGERRPVAAADGARYVAALLQRRMERSVLGQKEVAALA